ncbi:hypothetical protein T02_10006 [Trichinella nativa]|uniref:Uncharacterized protein n=1 Tax=Trichinella nativa TaxID=6335 RepID=A0A0V1L461_9BILA|nr:hypothetical protein T02_10006 [Trichinella nativa]
MVYPLNMPAAVQVAENYATFEYIRELVAQKSNCLCARTIILDYNYTFAHCNVDKQAVQLYAGRSAPKFNNSKLLQNIANAMQDANENKYVSLIFCICESSISKIINRIVSLNQ